MVAKESRSVRCVGEPCDPPAARTVSRRDRTCALNASDDHMRGGGLLLLTQLGGITRHYCPFIKNLKAL